MTCLLKELKLVLNGKKRKITPRHLHHTRHGRERKPLDHVTIWRSYIPRAIPIEIYVIAYIPKQIHKKCLRQLEFKKTKRKLYEEIKANTTEAGKNLG